MILEIENETIDKLPVLTAKINTGVDLLVKAGSQGLTKTDSTFSFVSISSEGAMIECDTGSDGFDLRIHGDFELKAFAEAFDFIAKVLKSRIVGD